MSGQSDTAPSAASPSRQATVAPRALRRTPARPRPAPKAVPKAAAGPAPAGMPQWLKDVLLVTGLLAATSFAAARMLACSSKSVSWR